MVDVLWGGSKRRTMRRMDEHAEATLEPGERVEVAARCRLNTRWFDWLPGLLSLLRLTWADHYLWLTDRRLIARSVLPPRRGEVFPRSSLKVVKYDPRMGSAELVLRSGASTIRLDFDPAWASEAEAINRLIPAG